MYVSTLKTPHDMTCGETQIHGNKCIIKEGEIVCWSQKILKRWARHLSSMYGICELTWETSTHLGASVFEKGQKTMEHFEKI